MTNADTILAAVTEAYQVRPDVNGLPYVSGRDIGYTLGIKTAEVTKVLKKLAKQGKVVQFGGVASSVCWHLPSAELDVCLKALAQVQTLVANGESDQEAACHAVLAVVESTCSELSKPFAGTFTSHALAQIPPTWTARIPHCYHCGTRHVVINGECQRRG